MRLLNIKEMIPDIYCQESRDFQILCNIYSAVTNTIKHESDTTFRVLDTKTCRAEMLELLSTKLGFFTDKNFSDADLREALSGFRDLVNNKGTLWSVSSAVNVFLKALGIHNKVRISVTTEKIVFGGKTIKDHTVIVSIESALQDTTLLEEIFKYIIPAGYEYIITFYLEIDPYDDLVLHENVTMLYVSDRRNSNVKGKVTWSNLLKFAYNDGTGWSKVGDTHSWTVNDDYTITFATTSYPITTDTFYLQDKSYFIKYLDAGTYTLSGGIEVGETTTTINLIGYNSSGTVVTSQVAGSTPVTFTVDENFYVDIYYSTNLTSASYYTLYPMLSKGTEALPYVQPSSPGNQSNNYIYVSYWNSGIQFDTGLLRPNYTNGALDVVQKYHATASGSYVIIPDKYYSAGTYIICSIMEDVVDNNGYEITNDDSNAYPAYKYIITYNSGTQEEITAGYDSVEITLEERAKIKVVVELPAKGNLTSSNRTFCMSELITHFDKFVPPGMTYTATVLGESVVRDLTTAEDKVIGAVDTIELIGNESRYTPWENNKNILKLSYSYIKGWKITDGDAFSNTYKCLSGKTYFDLELRSSTSSTAVLGSATFSTLGRISLTFTPTSSVSYIYIYHKSSNTMYIGFSCLLTKNITYTFSCDLERCDPTIIGGLQIRNLMVEKGSTMTEYEPHVIVDPSTSPLNYRGVVRALREVIDPTRGDFVGLLSGREYYVYINSTKKNLVFAGSYPTLQSIPTPVEDSVVCIISNNTYYRRGTDSWIELTLRAHLNSIKDCEITNLQENDLILTDKVIYYEYYGGWRALRHYPDVYKKIEEVT